MIKILLLKWLVPLSNSFSKRTDDCCFEFFSCLKLVLRCRVGDKKEAVNHQKMTEASHVFSNQETSNPAQVRHIPKRAGSAASAHHGCPPHGSCPGCALQHYIRCFTAALLKVQPQIVPPHLKTSCCAFLSTQRMYLESK